MTAGSGLSTGWGEWDGALHLLTAPLLRASTDAFIDHANFAIRWDELLDQPWSTGERCLIEAAYSIWSSDATINLGLVVNTLDSDNFRRLVEALCLARGANPAALTGPPR